MSSPIVRGGFILFGLPLTLVLGFFAFLGTLGIPELATHSEYVEPSALGVGGMIGITAAWIRVLAPGRKFRESARLLWITVLGLLMGIITAIRIAIWLFNTSSAILPWLAAVALIPALFLLGATLGERSVAL